VYKTVCNIFQSFVRIVPFDYIPILRNGKPIHFGKFEDNGVDKRSGMVIDKDTARLPKGGLPNPKERPLLPMPWSLKFELQCYENDVVNEDTLQRIFYEGGMFIGFGTYRGRYGKFSIEDWKTI
jgi:hypothetical protein